MRMGDIDSVQGAVRGARQQISVRQSQMRRSIGAAPDRFDSHLHHAAEMLARESLSETELCESYERVYGDAEKHARFRFI